jgi:hypothetical protein
MAAARSVTPGGALLRNSRMFAIPASIPAPPESAVGSRGSRTRTLAYPTHQIITTSNVARKRGDWGLKRPLPARATTKATFAMLRVNEIDSIEGITDYSSASDHGITLKKFEQLHLPVTVPETRSGFTRDSVRTHKSVFEEDGDVTDLDPKERIDKIDKRWKFNGPWLAGMGHGDFNQWIERTVRPRRAEFREFLKNKLVAEINNDKQQKALDAGEPAPSLLQSSDIREDQLLQYLRVLRNNRAQLFDMVGHFLDLAPLKAPNEEGEFSTSAALEGGSPYSARGPPITHPSAGLSYLRSSAFLENHPFYGPQEKHTPVEARVVRPRRGGDPRDLKIGVAGFIADAPVGDSRTNRKPGVHTRESGNIFDRLDIKKKGGSKLYVEPTEAVVNSIGRVELRVEEADPEAFLVAQELLGADETTTHRRPPPEPTPATRPVDIRNRFSDGYERVTSPPKLSGASQYGLNIGRFPLRRSSANTTRP